MIASARPRSAAARLECIPGALLGPPCRTAIAEASEERGGHLFDGEWRDEWEAWSRNGLFVDMCVLAGTDYLPSIVGVGVKTAHRELRRAKSLERAVPRLPNAPRGDDLKDYLAHARQARRNSGAQFWRAIRRAIL